MVRVYIPVELVRRVRQAAQNRCGYCLSPQHLILGRLQYEHRLPQVLAKQVIGNSARDEERRKGANTENDGWV
jgi:hypothetical protein